MDSHKHPEVRRKLKSILEKWIIRWKMEERIS